MPRSEPLYLLDIVEAAREIADYLDGLSYDEFAANPMMRRATLQLLTVIGEATARLSPELQQGHPEIDWAGIVGFRNRAVHAYFSVRWPIVWEAATRETPALAQQIAAILAQEYPPDQPPGDVDR